TARQIELSHSSSFSVSSLRRLVENARRFVRACAAGDVRASCVSAKNRANRRLSHHAFPMILEKHLMSKA
ncbi:MAG: hypothetical protein E6776_07765, partial [Eggerthella sp.]|nr:hypothetical protein [Eggerthella sp.]